MGAPSSLRHKPVIAVVGSSAPSEEARVLARDVGHSAVLHGFSIVSGGLGGVMAAASSGAQAAKPAWRRSHPEEDPPQVIGVLPSTDKGDANPDVDLVIPTGMGYARNALVVLTADGVIAVEGGTGTLSEVAYAWQFGRPVAALVPSGGWAARLAGQTLDDKRGDAVFAATSGEEAVGYIAAALRGGLP